MSDGGKQGKNSEKQAWNRGGPSPNPRGRGAKADAIVAAPSRALAMRDAWQNLATLVGTTRDKRTHASFWSDQVTYRDARELWRGNDMAARGVEKLVDEMLRKGFEITIQADEAGDKTPEAEPDEPVTLDAKARKYGDAFPPGMAGPVVPKKPPGVIEPEDDDPKRASDALMAKLEELCAVNALRQAMYYQRAYGGGAVMVGVDDGQEMWRPVKPGSIKSVKWLTPLTGDELLADRYYDDPASAKYGQPMTYVIYPRGVPNGATGNSRGQYTIHESRLLIFRGPVVDRDHMYERQGWGDSVFVRVAPVLRDFGTSWDAAAILLNGFAQEVYKMAGYADMLAANDPETLRLRFEMIDLAKSTLRMHVIDKQDDIGRQQTPVTGLPELIEKFCLRLAAAWEMPVALLMGQAPAGLNATGASDTRFFYDRVGACQESDLRPPMEMLIRYLLLAKDGPTNGVEPENWSLEFRPLWEMTEKEQADIRLIQAQVDEKEIGFGGITGDEVARSRHGGPRWSSVTRIDYASREEMANIHAEAEESFRTEKAKAAEEAKKNPPPDDDPPDGEGGGGPSGSDNKPADPPPDETDADRQDGGLLPFARMDFDEDQPRDEDGKFGSGGGGSTGGGGEKKSSAKGRSKKESPHKNTPTSQLAQKYREVVNDPEHAPSPRNGWKGSDEFRAVTKELKGRGIRTQGALERAIQAS